MKKILFVPLIVVFVFFTQVVKADFFLDSVQVKCSDKYFSIQEYTFGDEEFIESLNKIGINPLQTYGNALYGEFYSLEKNKDKYQDFLNNVYENKGIYFNNVNNIDCDFAGSSINFSLEFLPNPSSGQCSGAFQGFVLTVSFANNLILDKIHMSNNSCFSDLVPYFNKVEFVNRGKKLDVILHGIWIINPDIKELDIPINKYSLEKNFKGCDYLEIYTPSCPFDINGNAKVIQTFIVQ